MVVAYLYTYRIFYFTPPHPRPVPPFSYLLYCSVFRVKVVPNDYHDDHFDLRDPDQILGKTLVHANREKDDIVGRSEFDVGVIYHFVSFCQ
jgi:hypothetical protein